MVDGRVRDAGRPGRTERDNIAAGSMDEVFRIAGPRRPNGLGIRWVDSPVVRPKGDAAHRARPADDADRAADARGAAAAVRLRHDRPRSTTSTWPSSRPHPTEAVRQARGTASRPIPISRSGGYIAAGRRSDRTYCARDDADAVVVFADDYDRRTAGRRSRASRRCRPCSWSSTPRITNDGRRPEQAYLTQRPAVRGDRACAPTPELHLLYNPQMKSSYNFVPGHHGIDLHLDLRHDDLRVDRSREGDRNDGGAARVARAAAADRRWPR